MSKYHARKVTRDGMTFDSVKEFNRYCELRLLERGGAITNLECQVKFELIPAQRINGKVVERAISYVADFRYIENGKVIVEDVKGFKTPEYRLKKKLMLWIHGIRILET